MIKDVVIGHHLDGDWTVYLVRGDGMWMSVAYSANYPGTSAESVAASWREFLGFRAPVSDVVII